VPVTVVKARRRPAKRAERVRRHPDLRDKVVAASGAIEVELSGARIVLHGPVSEASLATVLRALARR
jgi:hypothetical protein